MTDFDLNTLADAYLRRGDENFWAWEEVTRATETDLNEGWKIAKLLLAKAESDDDLGYIAAGPLENLIDMFGHKALDLIEEEGKNNPKLQTCAQYGGCAVLLRRVRPLVLSPVQVRI